MWNELNSGSWKYDGCYAIRYMRAKKWGQWEWVNPPMINDGTIYKTYEKRSQNQPTYKKLENNISYWSTDGTTWIPEELFGDYNTTVAEGESIQNVIDGLPKIGNGHRAIITINGTHTEDIKLICLNGFNTIWLRFDPGAIMNGSIFIDQCRYVQLSTYGNGDNRWALNAGTKQALQCSGASNVFIASADITTTNATAIVSQYSSRVAVQECTVEATGTGNYKAALESTYGGSEIRATQTTISTNTMCGLTAHYSSYILFNGTNNAKTQQTIYAGGKIEIS